MPPTIDRRLNIVCEISRGEAPPLIVHSAALPVEVFELYFDLFGPTMNRLVVGGYGHFAPRYAALVLRQVALAAIPPVVQQDPEAHERAKAAVEARLTGLFNELRRITYAMALKDGRWEMMPIDDAKAAGALSEEESKRIDAMLVFFTCSSQSVPLEDAQAALGGLTLFNARTESSNATEFVRFLQTLTKGASSGANKDASPASSPGSPPTPALPPSSSASTSHASHGARPRHTGIAISSPGQ